MKKIRSVFLGLILMEIVGLYWILILLKYSGEESEMSSLILFSVFLHLIVLHVSFRKKAFNSQMIDELASQVKRLKNNFQLLNFGKSDRR